MGGRCIASADLCGELFRFSIKEGGELTLLSRLREYDGYVQVDRYVYIVDKVRLPPPSSSSREKS